MTGLLEAAARPAAPVVALARNRARYDALVDVAEQCLAAGQPERALAAAAVAAYFAWGGAVGVLTDPRLERLVVLAARGEAAPPVVDADRDTGRVLHVLSESYAIGGHTRLAWRWAQRDPRVADVVLTNQGAPIPGELTEAIQQSGGNVYDLLTGVTGLLDRARSLRTLMDASDLVVLHTHPNDVIAIAAASLPGTRPPIVLENHADHTYWLGLSVADVIACNRELAQRVCVEQRGVSLDRTVLLGLPMDAEPAALDRGELRSRMRIGSKAVVAICVADPRKMQPIFGMGFPELAHRLLRAIPELVLIMVGPDESDPAFKALSTRFRDRVHLLGQVVGASALYAAADVYLDSYPVSGGTSLLEAAPPGLPVLSLQDTEYYSEVWIAQSPGLADGVHKAASVDEYVLKVKQLARSRTARMAQGARTKDSVLAAHSGPGWLASLEALYAQARTASPISLDDLAAPVEDPRYHENLWQFQGGETQVLTFEHVMQPYVRQVDDQLRSWLQAAWLFAGAIADADADPDSSRARLRMQQGWEANPLLVLRALQLTAADARLSLSLPPITGTDEPTTLGVVLGLLADLGLDGESCGDVVIE